MNRIVKKIRYIKNNLWKKRAFERTKKELDEFSFENCLNNKKRSEYMIVSLTSFPARFENLHYVIKSIMFQTYKPDEIILYLDDNVESSQIPDSLNSLKEYGLKIEIRPLNMKPHKKYYYAMKEHPEAVVVTVDDDSIYHRTLLEELQATHERFPGCVAAARAHKVLFDAEGKIIKYNDWEWECRQKNKPSMQYLATGVGGVLYPPHCMDDCLFDYSLIEKLCLNADDIWLKYMQILKHTPVVICKPSLNEKRLVLLEESRMESLHAGNVHNNMNDVYIKNMSDYFNIGMKDFMDE